MFPQIVSVNNFPSQIPLAEKEINTAKLIFANDGAAVEYVVIKVEYIQNGETVASSLLQDGNDKVTLLKYKVEMPIGAKVNLFEDGFGEVTEMSWNIPAPSSIQSMTFMQATSTNGMVQQETARAGEETFDLYRLLGRRNAIAAEIWTYQYAQTLWVASCKCRLADASIKDCVLTAGEGGTIVTALPQ